MADHTGGRAWKAGPFARFCGGVAVSAIQLQGRVPFMAEGRAGRLEAQGKVNATSESENRSLYLLPPPAAITTYCLPVLLPSNVIGVACALAGSRVTHSSWPVSLSNTRNLESFVAPINNSPPAVTMDPPRLGAPVGGSPLAISSSTTPRTERQRKVP